jgi:hypothetical protein
MKLIPITGKYVSPIENQGTFENVTIEDREMIIRRKEKFLAVKFVLFYEKDGKEIILGSRLVEFQGMEDDEVSTNLTTYFKYPNPDFAPLFQPDENSTEEDWSKTMEWFERVPLMDYLEENAGVMPEGAVITEYGFATYEAVLNYFQGGTLQSPEIHITDPLAVGFLLNKLTINGEVVGKQFKFAE